MNFLIQLVLFLLLFCNLAAKSRIDRESHIAAKLRPDAPCWCKTFRSYVHQSTILLERRYGRDFLDSSTVFTSSGSLNTLEKRLLRTLETGDPFRILTLGGSYSLPNIFDGNAASFNVTRWLNGVLSASDCGVNAGPTSLHTPQGTCVDKSRKRQGTIYKKCAVSTIPGNDASLFCSTFENDTAVEASFHPSYKNIDDICDNTRPTQRRRCSVFTGSGRYATLVLASKGGTTTHDAAWRMGSLKASESVDMVVWDYGMNDMSTILYHRDFIKGFFEHLTMTFQNLSGIAAVYWNDHSRGIEESCAVNGQHEWTNDLPKLDYPILKSKFLDGPLRNVSFLSLSLPLYCIAAKCSPNDFLAANTQHPSDHGVAFFADLIIWQLLKFLTRISRKECIAGENPYTKVIPENPIQHSWYIDGMSGANLTLELDDTKKFYANDMPILLEDPSVQIWTITTSLVMYTPEFAAPLPINQAALLCVPAGGQEKYNNVFDVNRTLPFSSDEHWVPLSILVIMKAHCAGWHYTGVLEKYRTDTEHMYVPTSTLECPSGAVDGKTCHRPPWSDSEGYPHHKWPDFPMVKAVDLLFRFSSDLDISKLCFIDRCLPTILWKNESDGTFVLRSTTALKKAESNGQFCVDRGPLPSSKSTILYYAWYRADECFAWDSSNRGGKVDFDSWTGVIVHSAFFGAGTIVTL